MSNHPTFALAYADYVQHSDFDGALGGSTAPTFGSFANLQDPRLSKAAVWGDLGTNVYRVTFPEPLPLQCVSLLDVRYGGAIACQISYYDEEENLLNIRNDSDLIEYPSSAFVRHQHAFLPAPVTAIGIRIVLGGTGLDGPLSIGRFWASPLWAPANGIKSKWRSRTFDPGSMGLSEGVQGYPRGKQRGRLISLDLAHMTFEQAYGTAANTAMDLQQLGFLVGTTEHVMLFPRTRDAAMNFDDHIIHRLGVYGSLVEDVEIEHADGNYFQSRMVARELF